MAAARAALEGYEGACAARSVGQLRLGLSLGRDGVLERERAGREAAGLERAAIVAGAVVVEALPDNLAALDNDAAVAMMQRRLRGLLEAEIHVLVDLHCGKSTVLFEDRGCRM